MKGYFDRILSLGQILALPEGTHRTLINTDGRIDDPMKEIVNSRITGEEVIFTQMSGKAGRVHQFSNRFPDSAHEDIPSVVPVGLDNTFQGMNPAEIALIDTPHAQEQESLLRMPARMIMEGLLEVTDRAKIEVPLNLNHSQLGTGGLVDLTNKVPEIIIRQQRVDPRNTGTHDVKCKGKQDARQDREFNVQKQSSQESHQQDGGIPASTPKDALDFLAIDHVVSRDDQDARQGGSR
jgi:hypothetical protein